MFLSDVLRRVIQEESNLHLREIRLKPNRKDYSTVRNNSRPDSSYIRETIDLEKERNRPTKPLPPRKREQPSTADVSQDGGLQQGICS